MINSGRYLVMQRHECLETVLSALPEESEARKFFVRRLTMKCESDRDLLLSPEERNALSAHLTEILRYKPGY
jgi:hypothetical protein